MAFRFATLVNTFFENGFKLVKLALTMFPKFIDNVRTLDIQKREINITKDGGMDSPILKQIGSVFIPVNNIEKA